MTAGRKLINNDMKRCRKKPRCGNTGKLKSNIDSVGVLRRVLITC